MFPCFRVNMFLVLILDTKYLILFYSPKTIPPLITHGYG